MEKRVKKAISQVFGTMLLIVLVLFSIAIIYAVVRDVLKNARYEAKAKEAALLSDFEIEDAYIDRGGALVIIVKRGPGNASISDLQIIYGEKSRFVKKDLNGKIPGQNVIEEYRITDFNANEFESTTFEVKIALKISVEGKEILSSIVDVKKINLSYPEEFGEIYYASPNGLGNGSSISTPFQISDFWKLAKPGDTLYLLDGTYKGSKSMINPTEGINGTQGRPITVKALNEGKVLIDAEYIYSPVKLWKNNWFVIEGINACHSYRRASVFSIYYGEHNIIRRCCGWDAFDGNTNIFGVHYSSKYNLFEDCAGWGVARKTFSNSYGGDYTTYRRCWGRWEGSHVAGPKMTYSITYNSYNNTFENCIGTWNGQKMQETYVLKDYYGNDWRDSNGNTRTITNYAVEQAYGIFGIDGNKEDKRANTRLLGCIAYTTAEQRVPRTRGFLVTKQSHTYLKDCVAYMEQSVAPFGLYALNFWEANRYYRYNLSGYDDDAVMPTYNNGYFYNCIQSGTSGTTQPAWPTEQGAIVVDGTVIWKNSGPLVLQITNSTGIGATSSYIHSRWNQSNILLGTSVDSLYAPGENIYNTRKGANIYYRYENGILTRKLLWPWPMDQRIYDAMIISGREPVNVTETIFSIFGQAP